SFWFNSRAVVSAHCFEVTKPASLRAFGWIDQELSRTHIIEELPNLADNLISNFGPLLIAEYGAGLWVKSEVVEFARPIKTPVTTIVGASNDVVTATRDFSAGKYQLLESFKIDWDLQTTPCLDVFFCCPNRELVVVSHKRIVFRQINPIDLSADLDRLVTDECGTR